MAKRRWVLQAAVFSALRRIFRTYPPYSNVRNRAKEEFYIKSKKGKSLRRVRFKCEMCGKKYSSKNVAVDHIEPVIGISGLKRQPNGDPDFNVYIARLFCSEENLQLLCSPCHANKSKNENKQRNANTPKKRKTK